MTFLTTKRANALATPSPRAAWSQVAAAPSARFVACTTLTVGLNGCAWTLIQAADATGSVIQAGYAIAANYSSPTFPSLLEWANVLGEGGVID